MCALVLAWSYRSTPGSPGLRALCLGLKVVGIAALLACLLEPLWTSQRARPGANLFAVLADNSQGLQIKDRGAAQTRGEGLRALLDPATSLWQTKLAETFELRRYLFDARLQSSEDFHELAFDGRATALAASLQTLTSPTFMVWPAIRSVASSVQASCAIAPPGQNAGARARTSSPPSAVRDVVIRVVMIVPPSFVEAMADDRPTPATTARPTRCQRPACPRSTRAT